MTENSIVVSSPEKDLYINGLEAKAAEFAHDARAPNTIKAYASDWRRFSTWCEGSGKVALPASSQTVCLFVASIADDLCVSSIKRLLTAISQAHQLAGYTSPTTSALVKEVLKGLSRNKGTAPSPKLAIGTNELRAMVLSTPSGLRGVRDRAILLLGFLGAFRRSELVGLDADDVQEVPEQGLRVTIRKSKTDAFGHGRTIAIPYGKHPERHVQCWPCEAGPIRPRSGRDHYSELSQRQECCMKKDFQIGQ